MPIGRVAGLSSFGLGGHRPGTTEKGENHYSRLHKPSESAEKLPSGAKARDFVGPFRHD